PSRRPPGRRRDARRRPRLRRVHSMQRARLQERPPLKCPRGVLVRRQAASTRPERPLQRRPSRAEQRVTHYRAYLVRLTDTRYASWYPGGRLDARRRDESLCASLPDCPPSSLSVWPAALKPVASLDLLRRRR